MHSCAYSHSSISHQYCLPTGFFHLLMHLLDTRCQFSGNLQLISFHYALFICFFDALLHLTYIVDSTDKQLASLTLTDILFIVFIESNGIERNPIQHFPAELLADTPIHAIDINGVCVCTIVDGFNW